MKKEIVIVDIKHISSEDIFAEKIKQHNNKQIIALNPYSFYLLDNLNIEYETLHSYVSAELFRNRVLSNINLIEKSFTREYKNLLLVLINYISFIEYERTIKYILESLRISKIFYITDLENRDYDSTNNTSLFNTIKNIDIKWIIIPRITNKKTNNNLYKFNKNLLRKLLTKLFSRLFNIKILYDWENFIWLILKRSIFSFSYGQEIKNNNNSNIDILKKITFDSFYMIQIEEIFNRFTLQQKNIQSKERNIFFKTWLLNMDDYHSILNSKIFFYQHGNYFYKNIKLKYAEIAPKGINFVFNDYTKKLFNELGANKVHSVGSLKFQKNIKPKKIKYDYLYITQGHDYLGNLQYVDFDNSLHNFDGYELYQRHRGIIELFGTEFKDQTILIKVHPLVLNTGVYVPFWELALNYSNIKIDVISSMHELIEQSKYIISDYISSEFINREIHYKKDIILFSGAPTPLPENTLQDMSKMYILVKNIHDVSSTIKDIQDISKKRQRNDQVIEYYSSKKINTKKAVTQIINNELDIL